MPMYDFECPSCRTISEETVPSGVSTIDCPYCGETAEKVWVIAPKLCSVTVPDYPGSKAVKAGYQHTSHAPQSATKVQSGYGGSQSPKA